jgi:hypothetical protein
VISRGFGQGIKAGLALAALAVLAWLIFGKGMCNGISDVLNPPNSKIAKTPLGSFKGEVKDRLGDPKSRQVTGPRSCWSYRSREGQDYRLCFGRGDRLRTVKRISND